MNDKILVGVYQLENGTWGYRYTMTVNGKKKDVKKAKDENDNTFKTQKAAYRARQAALSRDTMNRTYKPKMSRMSFAEVYAEYCEFGRSGKAFATIRKQDSLWDNHLKDKFGKRFIDEISVAEINDYLEILYYTEGRAYTYVESF